MVELRTNKKKDNLTEKWRKSKYRENICQIINRQPVIERVERNQNLRN